MLNHDAAYDEDYLQGRITSEFALAQHISIKVESADDSGIVLSAPLAPNANYKGTAFGGSLFSVAVLTGWAWVTRYLAIHGLAADAVIQESTMRYLVPVHGTLRATLEAPAAEHVERFRRMLRRAGRSRIRLEVRLHHEGVLAAVFDGVFAVAAR